jgi:hypothetical protein
MRVMSTFVPVFRSAYDRFRSFRFRLPYIFPKPYVRPGFPVIAAALLQRLITLHHSGEGKER